MLIFENFVNKDGNNSYHVIAERSSYRSSYSYCNPSSYSRHHTHTRTNSSAARTHTRRHSAHNHGSWVPNCNCPALPAYTSAPPHTATAPDQSARRPAPPPSYRPRTAALPDPIHPSARDSPASTRSSCSSAGTAADPAPRRRGKSRWWRRDTPTTRRRSSCP